jgi:tetratricopeptide (TPR) repeat protein
MSKEAYHFFLKGNELLNFQEYEEGIEAYEEAINLDPNFLYSYNGKGDALSNLGRYQEAIEAYDQALNIDPNFAYKLILSYKDEASYNLQQYKNKIAKYNQDIGLNSSDIRQSIDIHFNDLHNKLTAESNVKKCQEAIEAYDQILEINPILHAENGKAVALISLGENYEAIDNIEEIQLAAEEIMLKAEGSKSMINDNPDHHN